MSDCSLKRISVLLRYHVIWFEVLAPVLAVGSSQSIADYLVAVSEFPQVIQGWFWVPGDTQTCNRCQWWNNWVSNQPRSSMLFPPPEFQTPKFWTVGEMSRKDEELSFKPSSRWCNVLLAINSWLWFWKAAWSHFLVIMWLTFALTSCCVHKAYFSYHFLQPPVEIAGNLCPVWINILAFIDKTWAHDYLLYKPIWPSAILAGQSCD